MHAVSDNLYNCEWMDTAIAFRWQTKLVVQHDYNELHLRPRGLFEITVWAWELAFGQSRARKEAH